MTNSSDTKIVITSLDLNCPYGSSVDRVIANLGVPNFNPQKHVFFGNENLFGFAISDPILPQPQFKRIRKKIDRFTALAMNSVYTCLSDTNLLEHHDPSRCGLFVGNALGGWSYVEDQMYELYQGDLDAINAYVATAWFPAAPQGEISIQFGIEGYSKTFSAGRLSSSFAIEHAIDCINSGYLDSAIAGGAEAPLSNLIYHAWNNSQLTRTKNILSEASAFVTLESKTNAALRNAKCYAEIEFIQFSDRLDELLINLFPLTDINKRGACAIIIDRDTELQAELAYSCAQLNLKRPDPVFCFEHLLGDSLGASFANKIVLACSILKGELKTISNDPSLASTLGKYLTVTDCIPPDCEQVAILSGDGYGHYALCLLTQPYSVVAT